MEQQLQKAQQLVIVITMVVIIEEEYPGDRKLMLMVMVMMMMLMMTMMIMIQKIHRKVNRSLSMTNLCVYSFCCEDREPLLGLHL